MKQQFTLRCAKFPIDWRSGHVCNASNPEIWLPHETAEAIARQYGQPFGVGYVLTDTDPYWLLDIDHCRQGCQWSPLAVDLLTRLSGCYVEVSQSGEGLHIVGAGRIPAHGCRNNERGIELYHTQRMISITGTNSSGNIDHDPGSALVSIVAQYFPPNTLNVSTEWTTEPVPGYTALLSDNQLLVLADQHEAFRDLWAGESTQTNSEGDFALCAQLSFWTGGNCERIETLFSRSGRVREKWTSREDYRRQTILKAVSSTSEYFSVSEVSDGGLIIGAGTGQHDMLFTELLPNGRPKPVLKNLIDLLEKFNIECRYNEISKQIEIDVPRLTEKDTDSRINVIESLCEQFQYPRSYVAAYVRTIARSRSYNPAYDWISSTHWDGVDRFGALALTLKSPHHVDKIKPLLKRWLIGAARAVMSTDGISGCGVIVLQGKQYAGKTRWFWRLLGKQTQLGIGGAVLNPHSRDSVRRCVSHWLVELGEIDGTFRRSDIAALKAFLDLKHDTFRVPYARDDSKYPRQTLFMASVNERQYLVDDTGNRRFWTIEVGDDIDSEHEIDIGQVWAQAHALALIGEQHWLTREEFDMLMNHNEAYRQMDDVEELMRTIYNLDAPRNRAMTSVEILSEIGLPVATTRNRRAASTIARVLGIKGGRLTGGRWVYDMPQIGVREKGGLFLIPKPPED